MIRVRATTKPNDVLETNEETSAQVRNCALERGKQVKKREERKLVKCYQEKELVM